ncbi:MAG: cache domain-containing protein [Pseudomonadota bacterium]
MKQLFTMLMLASSMLVAHAPALAAERGTTEEAVAMTRKAIAYMKANGKDKTFAEINRHGGQFSDRDLYVVVYDMNGKNLAHGANPRIVGKDLIDIRGGDGVYYMHDRIELIKAKGKGWQDYQFVDPLSKKVEPKSMYVERYEDVIVGCGIYKPH